MSDGSPAPRVAIVHESEVPWREVVAQQHGERRVSVYEKFLEWSKKMMVVLGRYDPGMIVERHGHKSDHIVYVLEGELTIGDRPCPPGTLAVLEVGAAFGPLFAGPQGCLLLEAWFGDPGPVPADRDGFLKLLAERGVERLPPPRFERPAAAPKRTDDPEYG